MNKLFTQIGDQKHKAVVFTHSMSMEQASDPYRRYKAAGRMGGLVAAGWLERNGNIFIRKK